MATNYQATVRINCWKQIECVGCGGTYRYKFVDRVSGSSQKSPAAAQKAAEKLATTNIEMAFEQRPCPWCGCLQSSMVGQTKDKYHFYLSVALLVLSGVVIGFGFTPSATLVTYSAAGWLVGGLSVLGLILHAVIARWNPNDDRAANRGVAHRLVARGEMKAVAKADADLAEGPPRVRSRAAVPLLVLAAVGTLAAFTPAVSKLAGGWPTADGTKPEVVGPGEKVRVWFPEQIESLGGYWSGRPSAKAECEGRPIFVQVESSETTWKYWRSGGNSPRNSSTNLWADVTMPNDPALVGKTVEVTVDLRAEYPWAVGNGYDSRKTEARRTARYTLAPPGTSAAYWKLYWLVPGGAAVFTVAGFLLGVTAVGLRKFTPPATILPADAPKGEDDPPALPSNDPPPPPADTPRADDRPGRL